MNKINDDINAVHKSNLINDDINVVHKSPNKSEKIKRKCDNIVIKNQSNSCYLDSLMVALFHHDNPFIQEVIFNNNINHNNIKELKDKAEEIRSELQKIYNLIANTLENKPIQTCVNIRKLFNDYVKLFTTNFPNDTAMEPTNYEKDQAEPVQILNLLTIIFNIKNTVKVNITRWGANLTTNKTQTSSDKDDQPFIFYIHQQDLMDKLSIQIKDYYPVKTEITHFDKNNLWQSNGKKYSQKIEEIEIVDSSLLFINIKRLFLNYNHNDMQYDNYNAAINHAIKLNTKVIPEEEIKLKTGKILKLYSIIVQQGINSGGHYICLYNCNDLWYEYDDLGPQITPIGTFDKIINNTNKKNYLNNCTDLLYIEKTE